MIVLDKQQFVVLKEALPAVTRDCLRETFGVSETTWVRLRDGRPVRPTTFARMIARYERVTGKHFPPELLQEAA